MNYKRILTSGLAIVLCCLAASADVVISKTTFPDDTFRQWVLSQKYGADGILTDEEIAQVYAIRVYKKGIRSLKGIEYFTALDELLCWDNELTSLDLSHNTALTVLCCSNNQIEDINVTGCTALGKIECSGNRIRGEVMDALIAALKPDATGSLLAINDDGDQNELTFRQVAAAVYKGWRTYKQTASGGMVPYEGVMPTGIQTVTGAEKTTDGNVYDLMGRRAEASLSVPGIYVKSGKKILVK